MRCARDPDLNETETKKLFVVESETIKQAMEKLSETARQILLVVDSQERLIGTVTDGDIRRGLLEGATFGEPISVVMYKEFKSIVEDRASLREEAKELMLKHKLRMIPITSITGLVRGALFWTDLFGGEKKAAPCPRSNKVVIMAGGKGKRMDPFTRIFPKPLVPIGNKTVIDLIMERFGEYGFNNFVYTLNYKKEYIKLFLKELNSNYNISWIEEEDFLGTAGSLAMLKNQVKESFFVTNCDTLIEVDFSGLLNWHKEHRAGITLVGCHSEVRIPFGVLELSNGKLERIDEKPVHDIIINTGLYVMEPHVIDYIKEGEKMDMNQLIEIVSKNETVSVYSIYKGWVDIGQWEEYKKNIDKLEA